MTSKRILSLMFAALLFVLMFAACGEYNLDRPYKADNGSYKEGTLSGATLVAPAEGVTIDLDSYDTPLDFVWNAPSYDGSGFAINTVLVDKPDGDFSKPLASYGISNPDTLHRAFTLDQAKDLPRIVEY